GSNGAGVAMRGGRPIRSPAGSAVWRRVASATGEVRNAPFSRGTTVLAVERDSSLRAGSVVLPGVGFVGTVLLKRRDRFDEHRETRRGGSPAAQWESADRRRNR